MATTPPSPAPQAPPTGGGGSNKILLGCGIGCGVLLLLAMIAAGVFYAKVVRPMQAAGAEMEAMLEQNQAKIDTLVALDSSYPSAIGDDLDGAALTPSQVDSYIAIRSSLGPSAEALAQARAAVGESLDMSQVGQGGTAAMSAVFGMMAKVVETGRAQMLVRGELLEKAAAELEAASMGQAELAGLVEIIEWRFLQEEEALTVALSESERADWSARKVALAFSRSLLDGAGSQMGASDRAKMERNLEEAEERLEDLRVVAGERSVLTDATRSLLESRRAELQALPKAGLSELATLSENSNPMKALEGLGALGG